MGHANALILEDDARFNDPLSGKRWLGARFLGYTPHKKPKRE
uniref:Uncharacterized protein n=1 Tax=Candidatus Kentrum sp. UNK TaxID=2126344 RepID=A0A451AYZ9_9GAMM|nr:MAG: hypothetical protein BECKUNK1418G_GA0071005_10536 [Candidatus Kentron sp. UNK]VFK71279.1 MAG: hypothetical protein BECKUNK1418H_GA0071006_105817 [Candidatus Kentron sp. UNK]